MGIMDKKVDEGSLVRCGEKEADYIHKKLIEHNIKYITNYDEYTFCIKDSCEKIIGGIVASRENERMTVDYLWVDDSVRGKGYGAKLIKHIESVAEDTGCIVIWLNTFGFQAPDFYIKMGYELFAVLEKCINGYSQYFFKKMITCHPER